MMTFINTHLICVFCKTTQCIDPSSADSETSIFQAIRCIPLLLMAWLLVSPGHQYTWYWLCRINITLLSMNKKIIHLHKFSVDKGRKNKYIFMFFSNTLRPRQNGWHFPGDIFKCILFNENVRVLNKISLKFANKGLLDNNTALVQIMAWHRTGNKPLSEPIMASFDDAYMHHLASMSWINSAQQKFILVVLNLVEEI